MRGDVLGAHSTSCGHFVTTFGEKQVGRFVGHSGGSGRTEEGRDALRTVSRFLEQLAGGAVSNAFTRKFLLIADQAGTDLENARLHRTAELFHQNDLILSGQGENPHHPGGIGAGRELPVVDFAERKVAAFVV